MRRIATFVIVAAVTATGLVWWLHDGDLRAAAEDAKQAAPGLTSWDADVLARDAGVPASEPSAAEPADPVQDAAPGAAPEAPPAP